MSHQVTIGGERLGNNKKNMDVALSGYERSTHDLGYVWRSTMASGTLVPFMTEVALPGDTFDINLSGLIMTHPTIGPLFGTYKIQYDLFQVPIRLYNPKLRTNRLNIGNDMSAIKLPQMELEAYGIIDYAQPPDNQQINPSSLLAYLGVRGLGNAQDSAEEGIVKRKFNGVPLLGYWDIYKNYYANKQEGIGVYIHKDVNAPTPTADSAQLISTTGTEPINTPTNAEPVLYGVVFTKESVIVIETTGMTNDTTADQFTMKMALSSQPNYQPVYILSDLFQNVFLDVDSQKAYFSNPIDGIKGQAVTKDIHEITTTPSADGQLNPEPSLKTFDLENIDEMGNTLLMTVNSSSAYIITKNTPAPYGPPLQDNDDTPNIRKYSKMFSQEGLGIKTYDSDLFNNWVEKEWIDGPDGVGEVTKIDTSEGSFTIDEFNLKSKVYDMLNRIAISGGTYEDWLDAVYDHDRRRTFDTPMYLGGMMQTLVFDEVVSNAASGDQPLGTLAGRGRVTGQDKGGKIVAKIDEPSYIMGIVSITPRLDYSQGNKWDMNLKTINDFHKPALDQIGFQDLITDQMAWWDTYCKTDGTGEIFQSAGKQPAWINYMTNVNVTRGNFAIPTNQMYMTLNRKYGIAKPEDQVKIADLTTYIDPSKFNNIFADVQLDAQNFWVQIGVDITARRKMSAKIMPNL